MGGPHGGHMGGPPIQNQAPPQGDRFQAVTAYRFVGGSGHKITLFFVFITYTNNVYFEFKMILSKEEDNELSFEANETIYVYVNYEGRYNLSKYLTKGVQH